MKKLLCISTALFLSACNQSIPEPSVVRKQEPASIPVPDERFELVRVQNFTDNLSYSNYRSVYILTDKKTGKEYVGVSGIGITELGSHNCGKGCTEPHEQ